MSGEVKVVATIDQHGAVSPVNIASGHKLLSPSSESNKEMEIQAMVGNAAVRTLMLTFQSR